MSDAAITTIVSGLITLTTMVIGFLTMLVKLKYGVDKAKEAAEEAAGKAKEVEKKIDNNTVITTQAREEATRAAAHTEICDEDRAKILKGLIDHDTRIAALESQVNAIKLSVDAVSKNIDSTRHEMRSHLQTLVNKLDLIMTASAQKSN